MIRSILIKIVVERQKHSKCEKQQIENSSKKYEQM